MRSLEHSPAAIFSSFPYHTHLDLKPAIWWPLLQSAVVISGLPKRLICWVDSATVTFIHFLDLCLKGFDSIF